MSDGISKSEQFIAGAQGLHRYLMEKWGIHLARQTLETRRCRWPEKMPPGRRFGGRVYFSTREVDEWVSRNLLPDHAA